MSDRPMTREEYADLVDALEDRWPKVPDNWGTSAIYDLLQAYPARIAQQAIDRIFNEGRQTCPAPSVVKAAMIEIAAESGTITVPEAPCEHPAIAIVAKHEDGSRTGICANQQCRHTETYPAGRLLHPDEVEKAVAAKTQPTPW